MATFSPQEAFRLLTRRTGRITSSAQAQQIIDAAGSQVVRKLELRLMQVLPTATPVDKGTARSGWVPGSVRSPNVITKAPSDDSVARTEARQRRAINMARAEFISRTYEVSQGLLFISNPVRWILPLNEGSSAQAPSKFVERGISTSIRSIR